MQQKKMIIAIILLFPFLTSRGQADSNRIETINTSFRKTLTVQPGIGIGNHFGKDLLCTNLLVAQPLKYLSIAVHTSLSYNNLLHRNFNYIKTNYNYSVCQSVGVGTAVVAKKSSHSLWLMFGLKHTGFKETLENPKFERVSKSISATSPDLGLRYNFTYGLGKCFFHTGLCLPLYPYPVKTSNPEALTENLGSINLEIGLGIRLG